LESPKICNPKLAIQNGDLIRDIETALKEGLQLTADFNRKFRGLKFGTWTCEDWSRFAEVFSKLVQDGVLETVVGYKAKLPDVAMQVWAHLRPAMLHHLQPVRKKYDIRSREAARNHLLEVGKLLEQHAPDLLTPNLHKAVCFAHIQEKECGLLGYFNELWGERAIRPLKTVMNKAKIEATKVGANAILTIVAAGKLAANNGSRSFLDPNIWDEDAQYNQEDDPNDNIGNETAAEGQAGMETSSPSLTSSAIGDEEYDHHDGLPSCGPDGPGRDATIQERRLVCEGMCKDEGILEYMGLNATHARPENPSMDIRIYSYAYIHDKQSITSCYFRRAVTRVGNMVQVQYKEQDRRTKRIITKKCVAMVEFYATVQYRDSATPDRTSTLALCRFFDKISEIGRDGPGKLWCAEVQLAKMSTNKVDWEAPHSRSWSVDSRNSPTAIYIESIDTKLMVMKCKKSLNTTNMTMKWMFSSYDFQSMMA
jgi:hypothetical protein